MSLVCADGDDVAELGDGVPHLVLRVEEVRAEPDSANWIRTKVADDAALAELAVARGVVRRRDGDGTSTPRGLAGRDDLEPRLVAEVDQELGERERALADLRDADLLDHVVARGRRVEGGNVRCAREEAARARRVLELGLERERPRVRLPADERRLEP